MGGSKTSIAGQNIFDPLGAAIERKTFGAGREAAKHRKKSKSGGSYDPTMEFLAQMQSQQEAQAAAAAEAQRQALIQSQIASGSMLQKQSETSALQGLAQEATMQRMHDASALGAEKQAETTAAQQATGGGFDVNAAQQEALANMGASRGMLPTTAANVAGIPPATPVNPAMAQLPKKANLFSLPKTSDIRFGGV